MKAVIQEIKTVIEAVTEKLSKDLNTSCNNPRDRQSQTGRAQEPSLLRWLLSLDRYRPHPKGKVKGNPHPWWEETWYKTGKNRSSSRMRTTRRKDRFESIETEASICKTGKIQMNTKMKNQEAHSKCLQEQSHLYESNTTMLKDPQNSYEEPIV